MTDIYGVDNLNHEGHRARVRARIREQGMDYMTPAEVLEYLLFPTIPYKDTLPIANELLEKYATLENVFHADFTELKKFKNMTEAAADFLNNIPEILAYYCGNVLHNKFTPGPYTIAPYLRGLFPRQDRESLIIVCINELQQIVHCEELVGDVAKVYVSIDKIAAVPQRLNVHRIIIAHNHPSNCPLPSAIDKVNTDVIRKTLKDWDIDLLDHLVFAYNRCYSFLLRMKFRIAKSIRSAPDHRPYLPPL